VAKANVKKNKKSGDIQIYHLPNHSWLPLDWIKVGSEHDKPEIVVCRTAFAILTRSRAWNQEIKYDYSKKFCGENRPNETWKTFDLWIQGDHIIGILAQKAQDGSSDAALELARIASMATFRLAKICDAQPKLVRELARLRRAWPVIKKRNAKLSKDEKKLFDQIELGADDFIELDSQTAKWKMDDAGSIAYGLIDYIRAARKSASSRKSTFRYGEFGKLAKKLGDFNDRNAKDWWGFARQILLFSYPEPYKIEELNRLVTAKSKLRSPGRIKQAVLDKIKARFFSFPRNTFYQTSSG
jgi:hypothetical protein